MGASVAALPAGGKDFRGGREPLPGDSSPDPGYSPRVRGLKKLLPLVGGLLLLDLVLNAAAFDPAAPLDSLLRPSLDVMLLVASVVLIAQAGPRARPWLRAGLVVPALFMIAAAAVTGPGPVAGFFEQRVLLAVIALAAAAGACWFAFDLVTRGLDSPLLRNAFLLAVFFLATLQVALHLPVFRQSASALLIVQLLPRGKTG